MNITIAFLSWLLDTVFAIIPRATPAREKLSQVRIVAHRGCHNSHAKENTMPAFSRAAINGVWGIEFDVRWTRDFVPVISHDENLKRVFNRDLNISDTDFSELRKQAPEVPSLRELVEAHGQQIHFMIEIKNELTTDTHAKLNNFSSALSRLTPKVDFHILSLEPQVTFPLLKDVYAPNVFLPTSLMNAKTLHKQTLHLNYAGLLGSYFLVTDKMLKNYLDNNQGIGTGFVRSKMALYREVNRGTTWVFSNHADQLQQYLHCDSKKKTS